MQRFRFTGRASREPRPASSYGPPRQCRPDCRSTIRRAAQPSCPARQSTMPEAWPDLVPIAKYPSNSSAMSSPKPAGSDPAPGEACGGALSKAGAARRCIERCARTASRKATQSSTLLCGGRGRMPRSARPVAWNFGRHIVGNERPEPETSGAQRSEGGLHFVGVSDPLFAVENIESRDRRRAPGSPKG